MAGRPHFPYFDAAALDPLVRHEPAEHQQCGAAAAVEGGARGRAHVAAVEDRRALVGDRLQRRTERRLSHEIVLAGRTSPGEEGPCDPRITTQAIGVMFQG